MLKKLFERLGRYRVIMDREDSEPYLERYYLFSKNRRNFPFNIFLHKFLKGDPDDVHDHPWPYATFILWGGYYEWTPYFNESGKMVNEVRKWRGPGHFRTCAANSYHRIELKPGKTCWTLFMPGKPKRDWGFLVNDEWVQHQQYFENRKEKKNAKLVR